MHSGGRKGKFVHLTMFAMVLNRQVTSQHRTWFTKGAQLHWSLASLQSMAMGWNDTEVNEVTMFCRVAGLFPKLLVERP